MVRVGMNPARNRTTAYRPARVTVAVLVYLPHLSGYFKHRLDVVKLCLTSLLEHTDAPYDLLVFDNGSCTEVSAYLDSLRRRNAIRYLLSSSTNIGKAGALRLMSGAAPGEVIAYTDDDTFFYPGWLQAHLEILDSYPNVGMVSGCPERTLFSYAVSSNLRLAETDPEVSLRRGKFIPDEWEREWAVSLGRDPDRYLEVVEQLDDILLERRGVKAFATACHNQFIAPSGVLRRQLEGEWSGRLMGGMRELEEALDEAGYHHLSTYGRTTRLIGNMVSPELAEEARKYSLHVESRGAASPGPRGPLSGRLLSWKPVRWFLQGTYNRLFWLLSQSDGGGRLPEERLVEGDPDVR